MRSRLLISTTVLLLAGHAAAVADDHPIRDEEKSKVAAAVKAEGCTGGEMELDDDGVFEVDDATCTDGRKYDFEFDRAFRLIVKEVDD